MSRLGCQGISLKRAALAAGFGLFAAYSSLTHADSDSRWWARVGPGYISLDEDVTLKANGTKIPGAHAEMTNDTTLLAEIGYKLDRNWSVGFTFGYPPKNKSYRKRYC